MPLFLWLIFLFIIFNLKGKETQVQGSLNTPARKRDKWSQRGMAYLNCRPGASDSVRRCQSASSCWITLMWWLSVESADVECNITTASPSTTTVDSILTSTLPRPLRPSPTTGKHRAAPSLRPGMTTGRVERPSYDRRATSTTSCVSARVASQLLTWKIRDQRRIAVTPAVR